MASWFGHTQTVASISKSVTTVAGGIICLETNLSNFMKKVIYYEGFFQRRSGNLPEDVNYAARKLLRRCHEYREAIREELQSSVAYVADAGRWIIGMEDWNTKMEKRMHQISELVILANSLLAEYAITGVPTSNDVLNDLSAYVNVFTSTITLQDDALFHDSLKAKTVSRHTSPQEAPHVATTPSPIDTSKRPSPPAPLPMALYPAPTADLDDFDRHDLDCSPVPDDDDRLNPFNVTMDTTLHVQPRTEPMTIPKKPDASTARDSVGSSGSSGGRSLSQSNSFPNDYCHLEREYGDELSEMTSFSSTAPRKEWRPMALPFPAKKRNGPAPKPYENAVYDLTVSFDFQKERTSNPFVAKTFAVERKNSLDEHPIMEEELGQDDATDEDDDGGRWWTRQGGPPHSSRVEASVDQANVDER